MSLLGGTLLLRSRYFYSGYKFTAASGNEAYLLEPVSSVIVRVPNQIEHKIGFHSISLCEEEHLSVGLQLKFTNCACELDGQLFDSIDALKVFYFNCFLVFRFLSWFPQSIIDTKVTFRLILTNMWEVKCKTSNM